MRTILLFATLLLAAPLLAEAAAADAGTPCPPPYVRPEWCPPPSLGPASVRVCSAEILFDCITWL